MEKKRRYKCDDCGIEVNRLKDLKKMNAGFFCSKCYSKRRKAHREYIKRDICGIRKRSDLEKEWAEKRKFQPPKIKGEMGIRIKSSNYFFYLTKAERQLLWKKFIKMGLPDIQADRRIKQITLHLQALVINLRNKNKTEIEISNKFKEEFAKLCMEVEANGKEM